MDQLRDQFGNIITYITLHNCIIRMASLGSISPPGHFLELPGNPTSPWEQRIRRFTNYILVIDVTEAKLKLSEEKKKAILLPCLGS